MGKFNFKTEIIFWLLLVIPFIYCGYLWNKLPESIPSHIDSELNVNSWGPKADLWVIPFVNVICYVLAVLAPWLNPERSIGVFGRHFYKFRLIAAVVFTILTVVMIREITFYVHIQGM